MTLKIGFFCLDIRQDLLGFRSFPKNIIIRKITIDLFRPTLLSFHYTHPNRKQKIQYNHILYSYMSYNSWTNLYGNLLLTTYDGSRRLGQTVCKKNVKQEFKVNQITAIIIIIWIHFETIANPNSISKHQLYFIYARKECSCSTRYDIYWNIRKIALKLI